MPVTVFARGVPDEAATLSTAFMNRLHKTYKCATREILGHSEGIDGESHANITLEMKA